MFLKHKPSGDLVEIMDLDQLFDPFESEVSGRFHAGEEMQDTAPFVKADLLFPSDEPLPRYWVDPHYKEKGAGQPRR